MDCLEIFEIELFLPKNIEIMCNIDETFSCFHNYYNILWIKSYVDFFSYAEICFIFLYFYDY